MSLKEMAAQLKDYSQLEGTEVGEYWASLAEVADRVEFGGSPEFVAAVIKEATDQLAWISTHTRIESREVTTTRKVPELIFLDE